MIRANVRPRFGWTCENPKALSTCRLGPQGIGLETHSLLLGNEHILHMLMVPHSGNRPLAGAL